MIDDQPFICGWFFFFILTTYTPICIITPYPYWYNLAESSTYTPICIHSEKKLLCMKSTREKLMEPLEHLLELGGTKKDITLLVLSGLAVVCSLAGIQPFPFDIAWVAIVLCGVPIILEAIIGLVTAFDIKADVLVSLALIASVCIGETFAAGEVAVIMQLGGLLEELTFSMTLNFIAIALAITGILNPVVGALVHNAGSVLVIINSALLLNWRNKK